MLSMQGKIDGEQILTGYLIGNGNVQMIKVTDYNKVASMLGKKQVILGSEKEVILLGIRISRITSKAIHLKEIMYPLKG